jgi:hypothetical protein
MIHGVWLCKVAVELFEEMKGTGRFPYETHSSQFWRLANCDHGGNVRTVLKLRIELIYERISSLLVL